jgi:Fe-S oxidoreductase
VDVATYKAEFLAHYYEGRLRPRYAYAFGLIDRWARLASIAPGLVNLCTQSAGSSTLLKLVAGMTRQRAIPTFAPETFRRWFERRPRQSNTRQRVLLWPDTFNNNFLSDTARAAFRVLEALDFEVVIPAKKLRCGRPLNDYGMLDTAKQYLERSLHVLEPHLRLGTPIVVLEPSCAAVFRDELPDLMPGRAAGQRLAQQALLLSEFSMRYAPERLPRPERRADCHHKSVLGFDAQRRTLAAMGLDVTLPPSACCGMAGSFGFAADEYPISAACGERVILPEVRRAGDATGGSHCETARGSSTAIDAARHASASSWRQ